jgi:hypothetical protein
MCNMPCPSTRPKSFGHLPENQSKLRPKPKVGSIWVHPSNFQSWADQGSVDSHTLDLLRAFRVGDRSPCPSDNLQNRTSGR